MDRINVLVVEEEAGGLDSILESLSNVEYIEVVGETGDGEEAMDLIGSAGPDVVLVGAHVPGEGYKLAEKIRSDYPGISVIMVERELKEETMRKAIFAGATDVIVYPFTPSKLVDAIYRSSQVAKRNQAIQREKSPGSRKKYRQGQLITVFSTKGGVGKTFVATNLAVSLAQNTEEKVALLDLDLDFGNAALALNVMPRYTISDVINELRNLDQDLLESYLIPHRSGIKLLAANAYPQMAEFINAEQIEIIIKVLQAAYDYVVVDMPARFYDPVDPAFQQADLLMLVTTQDVATLRNLKASLTALNSLNYPKHKIKMLLNRAETRGDIKPKDVETTLNSELYAVLPVDYKAVNSSLNKGIPVVLLYPRAKISRSFQQLARRIIGDGNAVQVKLDAVPEPSS